MFKFLSKAITNISATRLVTNKTFQTSLTQFNKLNEHKTSDINSTSNSKYNILQRIKNSLIKQEEGRSFAIIHVCGKQFKITSGDIILVQGYWPPTNGDRIRLDKVLLAGTNDFTLVGRPLLQNGVCDVQATIVEKTLSHTKTHFRKKRRKQYQRINFFRSPHTMIRINSININPKFDNINIDAKNKSKIFEQT